MLEHRIMIITIIFVIYYIFIAKNIFFCFRRGGLFGYLVARFAETALATLVGKEGIVEILVTEIGPELLAEIELGIGHLPKEEIADTEFATSADEQVGIGVVLGNKIVAKSVLGDVGGLEGAVLRFTTDGAESLGGFPAGAVAQGEDEGESGVASCLIDTLLKFVARFFGYAGYIADGLQLDIVVHEGLGFLTDGFDEQLHETVDFVLGTIPIFGAEGVKGEIFDPCGHSGLNRLADSRHGVLVTKNALMRLFLGPTAITIHNDGHMLWNTGFVDVF